MKIPLLCEAKSARPSAEACHGEIHCPSCFEMFSFTLPHDGIVIMSVEMDYDCEVCCRPMRVIVASDGAYAIGMDD